MKQNNKQIPERYKRTSLEIIPKDWEVKRMEEICEIDAHSLSSKTDQKYKFDYISLSDVYSKKNEITTTKQIFETAPSRARRIVKKGDVIISTVRPNLQGFTQIKDEVKDLIVSTGFSVLTPIKCESSYLYYYIFSQSITKQFFQLIVGSNYPAINSSDVTNLKIALPPLPEQKKIAEILSTWDNAIEQQSKLVKALTLRKHGLMQQLLTGKRRFAGFTERWRVKYFNQLFIERNETHQENLPLLSITANRGVILQSESDKRDISNKDKSKYKRICSNDIGYNTMRMWQGRSALSSMEGIVSPAYTIITPKKDVHPRYMAMLCKQPRIIYDFWAHSQGLVSDTLNCKFHDFGLVKALIPSYSEQTEIAKRLTTADLEIELEKQKLAILRNQKHGLMQKLLTGKKRVKLHTLNA